MKRALVAVTGASGAQYAVKIVEALSEANWEIDFIVTHPYWVYSVDKKNNKLLLNK